MPLNTPSIDEARAMTQFGDFTDIATLQQLRATRFPGGADIITCQICLHLWTTPSQIEILRRWSTILLKPTGKIVFTTSLPTVVLFGIISADRVHRQMWSNSVDRVKVLRMGFDVANGLRNVLPGFFSTPTVDTYPPYADMGTGFTAGGFKIMAAEMDGVITRAWERDTGSHAQYDNDINKFREPMKMTTLNTLKETNATVRWSGKPVEGWVSLSREG